MIRCRTGSQCRLRNSGPADAERLELQTANVYRKVSMICLRSFYVANQTLISKMVQQRPRQKYIDGRMLGLARKNLSVISPTPSPDFYMWSNSTKFGLDLLVITLREDLELCNDDLTTATVLARDRSRWRRLVETSSSV